MNITFEGSLYEFAKCFGQENPQHVLTQRFEVKIGSETLICVPISVDLSSQGHSWRGKPQVRIVADTYSKLEAEITEAKTLVNKTKEAHKEAQRKLSELMEEK